MFLKHLSPSSTVITNIVLSQPFSVVMRLVAVVAGVARAATTRLRAAAWPQFSRVSTSMTTPPVALSSLLLLLLFSSLLRISAVRPLYNKYFRRKANSVSARCSLAVAAQPALRRKLPQRRRPPPGKITLIDSMFFTSALRF